MAAIHAIRPPEIGVAKLADGLVAVFFPARPEVAARETAEDGGPPGVGTFALKGEVKFFYFVGHDAAKIRENAVCIFSLFLWAMMCGFRCLPYPISRVKKSFFQG